MKKLALALSLLLPLAISPAAFAARGGGGTTVTVDFSKPLQTIEGFGAAITWVAQDLPNFSSTNQTAILDALYNTNVPSAGLSWIRVGTMLCQFNPSSGTYNFSDPTIQSEVNWVSRVNAAYGTHNVFASTSSSSSLESTAALPTTGKVVLVLSNTSTSSETVNVTLQNTSSLPTSVTPYVTSSTQNQAPQSAIPVSTSGTFSITIAAHSVVTLVG
jgi:O-glycosyl hydrolase